MKQSANKVSHATMVPNLITVALIAMRKPAMHAILGPKHFLVIKSRVKNKAIDIPKVMNFA